MVTRWAGSKRGFVSSLTTAEQSAVYAKRIMELEKELAQFKEQLIEELESLGFDDPEMSISGGDVVNYVAALYADLKHK